LYKLVETTSFKIQTTIMLNLKTNHLTKILTSGAAAISVLAGIGLADSPAQAAVIAQSTFDNSAEGWLVKDLDPSFSTIVGTYTPTFQTIGGNPGGFISQTDPGPNAWFFSAPAKFLGDQSTAFGGSIRWNIKTDIIGSNLVPSIMLVGQSVTLFYPTLQKPGTSFTDPTSQFSVPLIPSGWRINNPQTGLQPTDIQFQQVLGNLSAIRLLGDWGNGFETTGLDNVVLSSAPTSAPIPETSSTFSLLAFGTLGAASTLKRKLKSSKSTEKETTKVS
jgi:hypothetical protein